jgi:hypothetical protein
MIMRKWIITQWRWLLDWIDEWKYQYEYNKITKKRKKVFEMDLKANARPVCYDDYGVRKHPKHKHNPNYWIFSPVEAVENVLKLHFIDNRRYYRLHIQGIQVDTQGDVIIVKISLTRPGLLIGSRGKDIDAITEKLTKVFGVETKILIDEIRKDINEIFICY